MSPVPSEADLCYSRFELGAFKIAAMYNVHVDQGSKNTGIFWNVVCV